MNTFIVDLKNKPSELAKVAEGRREGDRHHGLQRIDLWRQRDAGAGH